MIVNAVSSIDSPRTKRKVQFARDYSGSHHIETVTFDMRDDNDGRGGGDDDDDGDGNGDDDDDDDDNDDELMMMMIMMMN